MEQQVKKEIGWLAVTMVQRERWGKREQRKRIPKLR